jgi:hypothetical protein
MKLEVVARYRVDEFDYVLNESGDTDSRVLTLYHRGTTTRDATPLEGPPLGFGEITRWERSSLDTGGTRERVFESDVLDRVSVYRRDGRIVRETLYAEGMAAEELEFRYVGDQLRSVVARPPGGGDALWEVTYELTPQGRLRAVQRSGAGAEAAAFTFATGRLWEEELETAGHTVLLRYDGSGRRVVWEVYSGTSLTRATYDDYDTGTGSLSRTSDVVGAEERTDRVYDGEGNVTREDLYRRDRLLATITYAYDDGGRKISAERRTDGGIEAWAYRYTEDGTLEAEEYRERGAVRSRIVHTGQDTRYEEVVQSPRSSLRIYYEGNTRLREDFLRDGKVVRSRGLEEVR